MVWREQNLDEIQLIARVVAMFSVKSQILLVAGSLELYSLLIIFLNIAGKFERLCILPLVSAVAYLPISSEDTSYCKEIDTFQSKNIAQKIVHLKCYMNVLKSLLLSPGYKPIMNFFMRRMIALN